MASRGITGALLTEIGKHSVEYYECLNITVGSGYFITNAPRDITIPGHISSYKAVGQMLDFGDIEENVTFEVTGLEIRLSALPAYDDAGASWANRVLTETYQNRPVYMFRVYLDANGDYVGHFLIYEGFIDNVSIVFSPSGESAVSIETSSHWVDFQRTNGIYTNLNSHQSRAQINPSLASMATDLGFVYAAEVQKDLEWK